MKKNHSCLAVILPALALLFYSAELMSQPAYGQELSDLIKSADDEKGKKAGALIILKEYSSILNEKNENALTLRVVGKIYDNQALNDYSHIPLGFNSYYEDAILDFARVIRNDGSVVMVNKDAVQIKTTPDFGADTRYSDTKYLTFAFSGLEIGTAFEYQVRFVHKKSIIEGEWFDHYYLGGLLQKLSPPYVPRIDPVQTTVMRLIVPESLSIRYHLTFSHAIPAKTTKRKQDIYTWTINDIPGVAVESSMPSISSLLPVLSITTFKDWSQLNSCMREKLFSGIEINQEIKEKTNEITRNAISADEKIKAIANYIHDNIRYTYADLGRGGFTPHPLSEIISSRYGDCKDQSILFISLLNSIGIKALPVLVNQYPQDELTNVPALTFEHLIAVIPKEDDSIWIDLTSKGTRFPELAFSDRHRKALIVDGNSDKIVVTPGLNPETSTAVVTNTISFRGSDAISRISIEASGAIGETYKTLFVSADKENIKEFFQSVIKDHINNARVDSLSFPGIEKQETNFKGLVYSHVDTLWKKGEALFSFTSLASLPLALFSGMSSKSMPEKRENDIIYPFAYKIKCTEEYYPPVKSMFPIEIPKIDSLENEFIGFKRTFRNTKSGTAAIWEFNFKGTTIPKERYSAYRSAIKKAEEMSSWTITFVDPLAFALNLRDENPFAIINECNGLLKKDSGNTFALLIKGFCFGKVGRPDSAIRNLTRVLSDDPDNKYAHFWIAFPYFDKKMSTEAMKHLEKAINIDPSFIEAYDAIGAWYAKENQYDKAFAVFRKATDLNPENSMAWQTIAILAFQKKRYKESIEYFKRAITIDSTVTELYPLLAESYMNIKSYKLALETYQTAIRVSPEKGTLYGNMAWVYYLLNDDKKCIEYSKKAIETDSGLYFARFNLALANLRSGNISEANRLYNDLRKERLHIPSTQLIGALQDLDDLVAKGIRVQEANSILKSFNQDPALYK